MRRPWIVTSVLALLVGLGCTASAPPVGLAIENVTVIDGVSEARDNQRVVVDGDRIVSVARMDEPAAPAVETLDAAGLFLIPGLWDMHVHFLYDEALTDVMPALFLSHGITSVRDTGGELARLTALRDELEASGAPAPRVFVAGPLLDGELVVYDGGDPGRPPLGTTVPSAEVARQRVRDLADGGADFIKIYELVSPEVFDALVAEARSLGLPIASHVPLSMTADMAGSQVDSMEHLRNIELACAASWSNLLDARRIRFVEFGEGRGFDLRSQLHAEQRLPAIAEYDQTRCLEVMNALSNTIQVPTLRLNTNAMVRTFERPGWSEELAPYPNAVRRRWQAQAQRTSQTAPDADHTFAEWSLSLTSLVHGHGVPVGAGTDTPIGLGIPGYSLHTELELLVESGLTPQEALYAATVQPARFFGRDDEMGQVQAGMAADLVLLARNPLDDIRNTRSVEAVMARGQWVD